MHFIYAAALGKGRALREAIGSRSSAERPAVRGVVWTAITAAFNFDLDEGAPGAT